MSEFFSNNLLIKRTVHSLCLVFIFSSSVFSIDNDVLSNSPEDPAKQVKEYNIDSLDKTVRDAKERINTTYLTRAGDFLQVLPTVTVSKSSPITGEKKSSETYLSISLSASQLFGIREKRSGRDELQRRALRQIDSLSFSTRKLIERKTLLNSRLWKLSQIRKSLSSPVEVAALDEKVDDASMKLQETEIEIEKNFAEIEFLVVGCER
jgi:hypothetical protein